ncbi:MAG TPA: fatty acid desaturase [Rhodospirillaceae bacterium]|nr:fatty acid desaturase [Rhodospirillaceae bacterium]
MPEESAGGSTPASIEDWNRLLRPYSTPATLASLTQLTLTLALMFGGFAGMLLLEANVGYWAAICLAPITGLFLVRLFIIQHDCGHQSYFRQRWACDLVGRCLGVLTMTPYLWWKRDHDWHHSASGDLSRRGYGDIDTLTVREYRALGGWHRFRYRLYRHPLVLFGLGPLYQFLLRHRLPVGLRKDDRRSIVSILGTNLALAAMLAVGGLLLGFWRFSALWLPVVAVAATVGVWMFFVQHQFEKTYWAGRGEWSFVTAALQGCSYYRLPRILEWVTGSIGYHHIHHLASRIPNYRLRACFSEVVALRAVTIIEFRQSLACSRLALWCEDRQRLLGFREALA